MLEVRPSKSCTPIHDWRSLGDNDSTLPANALVLRNVCKNILIVRTPDIEKREVWVMVFSAPWVKEDSPLSGSSTPGGVTLTG